MSKTLPIIPIRTGVLFPGVSLPITAGRAPTLRAIDVALRDPDHLVLAIAQRDNADDVLPEGLYTVGTVAKLAAVQRGQNGVRLVLEGHVIWDRFQPTRVIALDEGIGAPERLAGGLIRRGFELVD